jgi:hypothetical protein
LEILADSVDVLHLPLVLKASQGMLDVLFDVLRV